MLDLWRFGLANQDSPPAVLLTLLAWLNTPNAPQRAKPRQRVEATGERNGRALTRRPFFPYRAARY